MAQAAEDDEAFDDLLIRADRALYAAKAAGRNRVRLAETARAEVVNTNTLPGLDAPATGVLRKLIECDVAEAARTPIRWVKKSWCCKALLPTGTAFIRWARI